MVASALGGFAVHFTRRVISGFSTPGNRAIASYAVGSLAMLPFIVWMFSYLRQRNLGESEAVGLSYMIAGGSFGLGVIIGWIVEPYDR